ncbi:hypothetical protein GHT06_020697 [Daphnia sinensis]|uniref:Uncharacterized protein n=1 Tax=Daphnia sinensis TaxID=1820382 RepID=A0AAD5L002_9CRUS|nr:hypothetical protein GHT06_020697 [Daphnia sinensis]
MAGDSMGEPMGSSSSEYYTTPAPTTTPLLRPPLHHSGAHHYTTPAPTTTPLRRPPLHHFRLGNYTEAYYYTATCAAPAYYTDAQLQNLRVSINEIRKCIKNCGKGEQKSMMAASLFLRHAIGCRIGGRVNKNS